MMMNGAKVIRILPPPFDPASAAAAINIAIPPILRIYVLP
jgi:hypothetical protein